MSHCWKLGNIGSSCAETCSDSTTEVDSDSCILYSSNYMEEDTLDGWFKAGGAPDDVCLQDGSVKGNSSNSSNNYPGAYISSGNCYFKDKDYERGLLGYHFNCNTKYETNKPLCKCKSTSTVCTGTPSDQEGKQSSIINFSLDILAEEVIGPLAFPYSRDAAKFTSTHHIKWLHILKTERISEDKGLTNSFHNWILEIIDPSYPNGSYFFFPKIFKYSYQGITSATLTEGNLVEMEEWYNPIEEQEGLQEQLSSIKFSTGDSGDSGWDIICPKITKDVTQYKLYRMFASTHEPEYRIPHNVGFPPTTKTQNSEGRAADVNFCQEEYYMDNIGGNCEAIWDDYHCFELGGRNFSNIQPTDTDIYNNTLLLSFRNNNTVDGSYPNNNYPVEDIELSPRKIDYNDIFFSVIKDYKVGDNPRSVYDEAAQCEDQTRLDKGWHCTNDKKFHYDGRLSPDGIPYSKRGLFSITRRKNLNGERPIKNSVEGSSSLGLRYYSNEMLKNYYIARKPPFGISFETSVTALTPEPPIYTDIGAGWFENVKRSSAAATAAAAGNSETTTTGTPSPGEDEDEDDFFSLDNTVFIGILILILCLCFGAVAAIALV